jgi:hypothetical protein
MSALSHYTRAITSEVGDIERRLQAVQRGLEKLGGPASSNARDSADGLSEAVASAVSNWADRFRRGSNSSYCGSTKGVVATVVGVHDVKALRNEPLP